MARSLKIRETYHNRFLPYRPLYDTFRCPSLSSLFSHTTTSWILQCLIMNLSWSRGYILCRRTMSKLLLFDGNCQATGYRYLCETGSFSRHFHSDKNTLSVAFSLSSLLLSREEEPYHVMVHGIKQSSQPLNSWSSLSNLSFMLAVMPSPFLDIQGNTIPEEQILGNGGSGLVLLQDNVAVKTPLKYRWGSDYDVEANTHSLRRE
ncbi:hypothetical protein BJY00DRAFT_52944 [Aspergillus carlsbadensis]|nr:hypothetical protein BJY00DRAFT_52944 [Aspergillus carlsbadensis]